MTTPTLTQTGEYEWRLDPLPGMRAEAVVFGGREIVSHLEAHALHQLANVASLPGLAGRVCALPDTHSGYGFPIGCVAAMRPGKGVASAGGVGFDIACGVRTLLTNLSEEDVRPRLPELAELLYAAVPSGTGRGGGFGLSSSALDDVLTKGAAFAVAKGYGGREDLERIEEGGRFEGADPSVVSAEARKRGQDQLGTLGSGNHYLEVQAVEKIFDAGLADGYGLFPGQVVVSIHCGSRGLGHQVATDFVARMNAEAPRHGLSLPDPDLACAPLASETALAYLGAMRAAANFALANRQIIAHLVRTVFGGAFRDAGPMPLLWDVSHNLCQPEEHRVGGRSMRLFVHRKGATRALPPGHPALPSHLSRFGQPVPVGGSMGTASYILAGVATSMERSFGSACHGAGRLMSRGQAKKRFKGRALLDSLRGQGVVIRSGSLSGVAEEAPGAYKDIEAVVAATQGAGLARAVARLRPLACVKG